MPEDRAGAVLCGKPASRVSKRGLLTLRVRPARRAEALGMVIGAQILAARKLLGWEPFQLAQRAGVTQRSSKGPKAERRRSPGIRKPSSESASIWRRRVHERRGTGREASE